MKAKPTNHPGEVVLELNRRDEALLAAASGDVTPSPFRLKKILVPIDFSDAGGHSGPQRLDCLRNYRGCEEVAGRHDRRFHPRPHGTEARFPR
jgi:hypothetical protein